MIYEFVIIVVSVCVAIIIVVFIITSLQENRESCIETCEHHNLDYVSFEHQTSKVVCICSDNEDNLIEKLVRVR